MRRRGGYLVHYSYDEISLSCCKKREPERVLGGEERKRVSPAAGRLEKKKKGKGNEGAERASLSSPAALIVVRVLSDLALDQIRSRLKGNFAV